MKKLLLTAFAFAITFAAQLAPSFACDCGKMYIYTPAHVTGFAAPCCDNPVVTGYALPCLAEDCNCCPEQKCCCKRSLWDKIFGRNKCCDECNAKECCEPKCKCECDCCD